MRLHPRKEAGIVVDFVPKGATHSERVVSLHSLLDADFYREGARVTPAPRRRHQRRARRKLSPAPWLVPVTPDVARRLAVIQREWQRVDPKFLDERRAAVLGRHRRPADPLRRARRVRPEADGPRREQGGAREVPLDLRGREPEPAAADDGARRPRLDAERQRRLRRPRHARDAGAPVGEGPAAGDPDAPARDRGGHADRARADARALDVAARPRLAQGAGPARVVGVPGGEAAARRARELARAPARGERGAARPGGARSSRSRSAWRCSPRPRATRRARTSSSTRRASRSRRCPRSRPRSPRTCPRRRPRPSKRRRRRRKKKGGAEAQANGAAPAEAVNGAAPEGETPAAEGEAAAPPEAAAPAAPALLAARANGDGAAPAEAEPTAGRARPDGRLTTCAARRNLERGWRLSSSSRSSRA